MVNYAEPGGVPNFLACIGRGPLQYIFNTQKNGISIKKKNHKPKTNPTQKDKRKKKWRKRSSVFFFL